jgi:hypothetical protein
MKFDMLNLGRFSPYNFLSFYRLYEIISLLFLLLFFFNEGLCFECFSLTCEVQQPCDAQRSSLYCGSALFLNFICVCVFYDNFLY